MTKKRRKTQSTSDGTGLGNERGRGKLRPLSMGGIMKIGSLFDGSGAFPLAAQKHGIEPAWASEIMDFPVRVTKARFPGMRHLGDVNKIDGGAIEPVHVVTFGSPCNDLSTAGDRKGIVDGRKSNLFFHAIRIIREMREATNGKYPTFAVFENVHGVLSCNGGKDFHAALEAFAGITDRSVSLPRPEKWLNAGSIMGKDCSIAWRTMDAKYWGLPQRRKRVFLVARFDTGAPTAQQILFDPEGLCRNPREGIGEPETAKGTSGSTPRGGLKGAKLYSRMKYGRYAESEVASTQTEVQYKNLTDIVVEDGRARRLTPLESGRLQGFPDEWTHGVGGSDRDRFSMWGNGVSLPCAEYIMEGIRKGVTK